MVPTSLSVSAKVRIDAILAAAVNTHGGPGAVPPTYVSVLTADGPLYSKGHGTIRDGSTIDGDVVLRFFSSTKLITSIAALQLVDRSVLSLDMEVGSVLKGLEKPRILTGYEGDKPTFVDAKNKVTLRHLLNHSSGLSMSWFSTDLTRYAAELALSGASKEEQLYNQPLLFEPGTQFRYSPGTDYVGRLIELVTGNTLEDYLQTNILRPLSMDSTSFILSPALKARATFPVAYRHEGQLLIEVPPSVASHIFADHPDDPSPWFMGAWGLHSTFNDYAKLIQHLLQLGVKGKEPDVPRLLSEESYASLFEGTLSKEAKEHGFLGKFVSRGIHGREGEMDWSTAWCVTEQDWEGMRRRGTGFWDGLAHTEAFIDPTTGIGMVGGTQLHDQGPETRDVWADLERAVYSGLE